MSDFKFFRIKCTEFNLYRGSAPDLAKQGAVGRLGNVKDSEKTVSVSAMAYAGFCQRRSLPSIFRAAHKDGDKFSNLLSRSRRRKTVAPPPPEKLRRVDLSVE